MSKKTKIVIIFAALVLSFACGSESDWLDGEYSGTNKLFLTSPSSSLDSDSGSPIRQEEGNLKFQVWGRPRLGITAPLPDCNLNFYPTNNSNEYGLDTSVQYKGESNNGKKCQAVVPGETPFEAEIYHGKATLEENGEMVLKIHFGKLDSPGSQRYVYEFRGRKRGLF